MSQTSSSNSEFTIGRLATAAGVNVETVRYYQRIGLIEEPQKPEQGYRKYSATTLEQLKFIKRAQQLGFSLQEISDLLEMGDGHCRDIRLRAEQKRDKIRKQIRDLMALQDTLDTLINSCLAGDDTQKCPIVETLISQDD